MEKKKWSFRLPHVFTLLLIIIAVCTLLTYVIPAGQYDTYTDANGRELLVNDSYHRIDQTPVGLLDALMAVQMGIIQTVDIAAFIFIVGGAFGVVGETRAIEAGVGIVLKKTAKRQGLIIPLLIFIVGLWALARGPLACLRNAWY